LELRNEQKQFEERLYGGSDVNLIETDLQKETLMLQSQNDLIREQMMVLHTQVAPLVLIILTIVSMEHQQQHP